jgi:predicted AlkP superfamily pyrophosphatase or phosphodiesterase
MKDLYLPDYKGGSIINLVSSIEGAFGSKNPYPNSSFLNSKEIKRYKNVVLFVIDGLGYDFLMKNGKGTIFNENLKAKMTSVFPSATTAAIPMFFTGTDCQQHGLTGWYSYLEEFAGQIIPLRYVMRANSKVSLDKVRDIKEVFNLKPLANRINAKTFVLNPEEYIDSVFSIAAAGKSKRIGYKESNFFKKIRDILKKDGKKYVYAYWPYHDSLCHKFGSTSKKVLRNFRKLDVGFRKFVGSINGTDTLVIVTADHGILDIPANKRIDLRNYLKIKETLAMPLCGEHTYSYAYIKPGKVRKFKRYVKREFGEHCDLFKGSEFVKKQVFGLSEPSEKFLRRIGDYIIIMKEGYAIYDRVGLERKHPFSIGTHGGFSKEEMFVPLIVLASD